ncbi:hypothetical protein ACKVWC_002636 [Pyricularia oryzae]
MLGRDNHVSIIPGLKSTTQKTTISKQYDATGPPSYATDDEDMEFKQKTNYETDQASYAEERAEDEAREVERDSEQAEYEAREAEYERERAEYEAFEAEQKAIYEAEFRNFYRAYQTFYEAYYDAFKAFKAVADFEGSDDWEATVDQRMVYTMHDLYDWNEECMDRLRDRWTDVHSD